MSTAAEHNMLGNCSLALTHGLIVLGPIKLLNPPEPIPDAKGSLSHQQLRELAQKHKPPMSWYEGDEEQLF